MRRRRQQPEERRYFLTVPDVMGIYELGRNAVYDQANQYLATDGAEGIPCHRYGKQFRFPRLAIEKDIGEPIHLMRPHVEDTDHSERAPGAEPQESSSTDPEQPPLPFSE